jgi:uncharacterized protein (TIGR03118 family)
MKFNLPIQRPLALFASLALSGAIASAQDFDAFAKTVKPPVFASTDSDSDILGVANDTDPNMINPWGLTPGPEGNLHVNNNGAGVTSHYSRNGVLITGSAIPQEFTVPTVSGTGTVGSPSGIVLNKFSYLATGTDDFLITGTNGRSAPSHYLIVTEDGAICGYNEKIQPDSAIVVTSTDTAGYTGVALSFVTGTDGSILTGTNGKPIYDHRLYAANFRAGTVDEYDSSFNKIALSGTAFVDPDLPTTGLPANASWSPFNVHHIAFLGEVPGGKLSSQLRILVAYALHSGTGNLMNDIPGPGNGAVAIFTTGGKFIRELVPAAIGTGVLNSPWAIAISHTPVSSAHAGTFVLIGNHGDGLIHYYGYFANDEQQPGIFLGTMMNAEGNPLAFDGLWALHFGPKRESITEFEDDIFDLGEDDANLYFSAGLLDEKHGLVGRIIVPHIK